MRRNLFSIILVITLLSVSINTFAQQTVNGTITDKEYGQCIPGVTVLIKGTDIGTISDMDGKYKIVVPEGSEYLIFSYIGMKTEEVKISGSTVDLAMISESEEIAEILIIASFA